MLKKYYHEKIIRNIAQCALCGDVIESLSGHHYVSCKCGEISVDGGTNYLRRTANHLNNIINLSIVEQIERPPYDWEKD